MKIAQTYSHLNGLEFLLVHKPDLWNEVEEIIAEVDITAYQATLFDQEQVGKRRLYSSVDVHFTFKQTLIKWTWREGSLSYGNAVGEDRRLRETIAPSQKSRRESGDFSHDMIYNCQTSLIKDRVGIEVQFGEPSLAAYDLFVKHLAFYVGDQIDVGIEILPMKSLQAQMSSGVAYYEGELYNVIRQGRGVPSVPLVLIGLEA